MLITRRKIDLQDKKPGAIADHDTKVVWVRMLKRPKHLNKLGCNQALALRGRFNAVLEERLANGPNNLHLMSITVQNTDFDLSGYLTSSEKKTFWQEVDRGLMKFDTYEIKLLPRGNQIQNAKVNPNNQSRSCSRSWQDDHTRHQPSHSRERSERDR